MKYFSRRRILFPVHASHAVALMMVFLGPLNAATFTLDESGALQEIGIDGERLACDQRLGGFMARDVVAGVSLDLSKGTVERLGDRTVFKTRGSHGISLHAEFLPRDGYVLVTGRLRNSTRDDRAIILDYRVGLTGKDAVFSNALNRNEDFRILDDDPEHEGNAFPVAALDTADGALALAIPPREPRTFGLVGGAKGISIRFYLGITALTKAFPNEAAFSFIVYPSRRGWGFRGALEKYYAFYPEHYEARSRDAGYYMRQVKGVVPENIDQYAYNRIEIQSPDIETDLDRDTRHNLTSLVYMLVGQREIKFLDRLPKDYDEAMKALHRWSVESHKKNPLSWVAATAGSDAWLREEVESSAVKGPDDKYTLVIRNTPWGGKSVSFKVNPSPYLFDDREVTTVGKTSSRLIADWLTRHPRIDGVTVDSLGANWPAIPNYRRDHFEYARYPVTFDSQGRLFVHNTTSHYEWIQYLDEMLDSQDKWLFGNGVYAYRTRELEHYRAQDRSAQIKVGRFFISALLDGATSEAGTRARMERCQDVRVMMGRKYYALTNYEWEDEANVREFFNRSLTYSIFAINSLDFGAFTGREYIEGVFEGVPYVNTPAYYRDKQLLDWFLPKAQLLFRAGWQPVTFAEPVAGGDSVFVERYGNGNSVYLAVFNDSTNRTDCTIKVDLDSLGFSEGKADYREIARQGDVQKLDDATIKLSLEPHRTSIIRLTRSR